MSCESARHYGLARAPAPQFPATVGDLAGFRQVLGDHAGWARAQFEAGAPITELVTARALLIDGLLRHVWKPLFKEIDGFALLAVGGYGRGELHPHSDVDLLLLAARPPEAEAAEAVQRFLTFLWDIGLEVGHSVRTLDDCAREAAADITVMTNLMEARLLVGPAQVLRDLRKRIDPGTMLDVARFFAAKLEEQNARHHRYNDSEYKLEPNVKEGPGGLRDIQTISWVAKRHYGVDLDRSLVDLGYVTDRECTELMQGQAFLWRVRFGLHLIAGRREERLLFDHQRALAKMFGYRDDDANLAVEQFMQRYFRTVNQLARLNEMLLQLFREHILLAATPDDATPIDATFQARRGYLEVVHERAFAEDPAALLRLFRVLQDRPDLAGVRAQTIRLVRENLHRIDDRLRADPNACAMFMTILRQPRGIIHALRRMHRYGVLGAWLPAFGAVSGRMQFDLFHVYTVDEHTLFVVRNLRRFALPEFADELPLCTQIFGTLRRPELLYLGGLFHDIAKGRGGDHSRLGVEDVREFGQRHALTPDAIELVAWLVENHLIMSTTAQREDIADPEVVARFAAKVGTTERLEYLYLLTVADIRGTNPEIWNSWKGALLRELYFAARRCLADTEILADDAALAAANRTAALERLRPKRRKKLATEALWARLPEAYFARTPAEDIAWHTRVLLEAGAVDSPRVAVNPSPARGGTEIFVYGPEHHGLFAKITAAIEQLGLSIHGARIYSTDDGQVLDSFTVLDAEGRPVGAAERDGLGEAMEPALGANRPLPPQRVQRPSRRARAFQKPTETRITPIAGTPYTRVEIATTDRNGLLSTIARVFVDCGLDVHAARIATIGARAEDVFDVSDAASRGALLDEQRDCLGTTLTGALDR